MAYLISKGLALQTKDIDFKILKKIKRKLTVEHRGFNQQVKTIQAFRSDTKNGYLQLAHSLGYRLVKDLLPHIEIENLLSIGEPINLKREDTIMELSTEQKAITKYLIDNVYTPIRIKKGKGRCIFELRAGRGKTYIAMYMIYKWQRKSLYIVPGENLVKQTVDKLKECFPTLTIGIYYGKKHVDGDIVVASIDSIYKSDELELNGKMISSLDWFKRFGATVIDEVQLFCTAKRAEIFRKIASNLVMGMSATCNDRLDHMDPIAHYYLGQPIIMAEELKDQIVEEEKFNYKVNVTKIEYDAPDEYSETKTVGCYNANKGENIETTSHPKMINQFSGDEFRNQLIVDKIMQIYNMGHKVFTFFDRRKIIEEMLPLIASKFDKNVVAAPELEIKSVKGGTSDEDRKIAKEKSKVCLVTYACGGIGLSYPQYTAGIFAHSRRNNYKQFNNRIFRLDGPKEVTRELIYISDNRTTLKSQYNGFKTALKIEYPDAVIKIEKISYKDIVVSKEVAELSKKIRQHYIDIKEEKRND